MAPSQQGIKQFRIFISLELSATSATRREHSTEWKTVIDRRRKVPATGEVTGAFNLQENKSNIGN